MSTIVVDEPDHIAQSFDLVDELTTEHGLVTSEMVPALLSAQADRRRGGFRLARHSYDASPDWRISRLAPALSGPSE